MILVTSSEVDTKASKLDTKKRPERLQEDQYKKAHLVKMTLITASFVQSAKKVLKIWSYMANAIAEVGLDN